MVGKLDKEINEVLYRKKIKDQEDQKKNNKNLEEGRRIFYQGLSKIILNKIRKNKESYQKKILKLFTREIREIILWSGHLNLDFPYLSRNAFIKKTYNLMKTKQGIRQELITYNSVSKQRPLLDQICMELDIEDRKGDLYLRWNYYRKNFVLKTKMIVNLKIFD